MKKLLLFFLLAVYLHSMKASETCVHIWTAAGQEYFFSLDDNPRMEFVGDELLMVSKTGQISFPSDQYLKFTLEEGGSGIADVSVEKPRFEISSNSIKIENCLQFSKLKIFSAEGKLLKVLQDKINTEVIDISDLQSGAYILSIDSFIFKFYKK